MLKSVFAKSVSRHRLIAALAALSAAPMAEAGTVELGGDIQAIYSVEASLAIGYRAKNPDPDLIAIGDGGKASAGTQSHDQNFKKGEIFTKLGKVVADLNLKRGEDGFFLRGKAFENFRLTQDTVRFGAASNNFTPNAKLSDKDFDTSLSKFKGAEILDAYGYTTFDLLEERPLTLRLGQHVVNMGETLFIPGFNYYQVFDVTALRSPGTLLKEAFLPVPQLSFNQSLGDSRSLEGWIQFEHKKAVLDGCGTYWSNIGVLNCRKDVLYVSPETGTSQNNFNGTGPNQGINYKFSKLPDDEPKNPLQFALGYRQFVEAADTEFGAFYVNYAPHFPNLSIVRRDANSPNANQHPAGSAFAKSTVAAGPYAQNISAFYDYSALNIQSFATTASTVLGGYSVSSELSYTKDFPVQINTYDALMAILYRKGPLAYLNQGTQGAIIRGYDRKDKYQINVNTIKIFSNALGAANIRLIAEGAYEYYTGIGDPYTTRRYGRNFEYGAAQHKDYGGDCVAAQTNPKNCTQKGYYTPEAYGYRVRAEAEYPQLIPEINFKPRLVLSHDVAGYSADNLFSEGRYAISPAARFEYAKQYYLDLSYTGYNSKARFDNLHDRDFFAVVVGASF